MANYQHVKGLSIVTFNEGKKLGKVDELAVDPNSKKLRWMRVQSGGMFGESSWIAVEAVRGLGEHAVVVNGEGDLKNKDEAPEAKELFDSPHSIAGKKVVTEDGRALGSVQDYEFSPDDFKLTQIHISRTLDLSGRSVTVPADKVMTIGEDVILVASGAYTAPEEGMLHADEPSVDERFSTDGHADKPMAQKA